MRNYGWAFGIGKGKVIEVLNADNAMRLLGDMTASIKTLSAVATASVKEKKQKKKKKSIADPPEKKTIPQLISKLQDKAVTVKFVCGNMEQKYKLTKAKAWRELIKDELTWIPKKFGLDQYCLRTENGDVLDIDLQPVTCPLQLMVTRDGPWWADDKGLYFRSSPKPKSIFKIPSW
ncbi:hypothetical protein DPMN_119704 [Dreissena polymorpha]|uniref:Uncharacterized protein n=1 Tax=Dreissena polymorpha TaxID=45954 RepID=A0A9D4GJN3_DREPO|nr:hypothetical protein DPMN_119704 [Dreissena polymorpha]